MRRSGKVKTRIVQVDAGKTSRRTDTLAVEEPLEIQLQAGNAPLRALPTEVLAPASRPNGETTEFETLQASTIDKVAAPHTQTLAITMRTPGHDYELAAGFLYAEGIIRHKSDISHMIYCVDGRLEQQEYNLLRVRLTRPNLPELHQLERHFFTNSACGVCGRTMLESLESQNLPPLATDLQVDWSRIVAMPERLRRAQTLFDATGGLHAVALFDSQGELLVVREDIGRHNALDKLIGWALLNNRLPLNDHIILVSGRASYELLQKCRVAGAPIFCAVSAPSSLAVELADRFGITLVAFLRQNHFNIYSHSGRIAANPSTG